ncbi:hypothetical protein CL673_07410 [Candidatus Bathyarchaeota archaeon]|nr:hypothetical protein [Candidatus Bathyarchaeota archaeon]MDP6048769.1 hypothetical protein [Candidatus Bathyarchaeota archaeon]MDP7443024.1 hypothetical protein [Candidatus Bathyarchaeota archaeon]
MIDESPEKKTKDFIVKPEKTVGFQVPTLDISEDREEEILDILAKRIVDNRLESVAMLFLIPLRPISPIVSQLTLLPFAPLLEAFDIPGFDYIAFLNNSNNVKGLVERIEFLAKERDEKKRKENNQRDKGDNWFSRLMKIIGL